MEAIKALPFLGIVAAVVYFAITTDQHPPVKKNSDPVKESGTVSHVLRQADDSPSATLHVRHPDTGTTADIDIYPSGWAYVRRVDGSATSSGTATGASVAGGSSTSPRWVAPRFDVEIQRHDYLADLRWDIGLFSCMRLSKQDRESVIDVGLRVSPARLLYGVVAPDLLISPYQAGVGASLYLPDNIRAGIFSRIGAGCAWMSDYRGKTGFNPYISISARF
jgi:hypothetical protein